MRILIVGQDKIFSIENFYVKYFIEMGHEVFRFSPRNILQDYIQDSFLHKVLLRLGWSSVIKSINKEFLDIVGTNEPDVVWIFKGMEILPEALRKVRQKGIPLINYNPDNPFIFSGRGSGNANIRESISLYDLHFTYNHEVQKRLQTEYGAVTEILLFGFEVSEELYSICANQDEISGVCFLGNPDRFRAKFILELARAGIKIDVYGHDWNQYIEHDFIKLHGPVYGDEQWKALRRYRVQLNLMRPHNLDSHNMRTFEIPGIGGIMLASDTAEHRLLFENGKEAFLFKDVPECLAHISFLTKLSLEESLKIRYAARKRSIDSGYNYGNRAITAIRAIEALIQ